MSYNNLRDAVHDEIALSQYLRILLVQNTLSPAFDVLRGDANAMRLKWLKLSVEKAWLIQADEHTDESSDIATLGVILAPHSHRNDEVFEFTGEA